MESEFESQRRARRTASATLTENEVRIIRWKLDHGEATPRELSIIYQVGVETIRKIGRRESWIWVTDSPGIDDMTEDMLSKPIPEWMKRAAAESAKKLQEQGFVTESGLDRLAQEAAKDAPRQELIKRVGDELEAFVKGAPDEQA